MPMSMKWKLLSTTKTHSFISRAGWEYIKPKLKADFITETDLPPKTEKDARNGVRERERGEIRKIFGEIGNGKERKWEREGMVI